MGCCTSRDKDKKNKDDEDNPLLNFINPPSPRYVRSSTI